MIYCGFWLACNSCLQVTKLNLCIQNKHQPDYSLLIEVLGVIRQAKMLYFPRKSQGIKSGLPGFVVCSEYGYGNSGSLSSMFFSVLFQATLQPQLITSSDTGEEEKEGWTSCNISLHPHMLSVYWHVGCRPEMTSHCTQLQLEQKQMLLSKPYRHQQEHG